MITIIAALSKNHVIGKDNQLIWKVPGDLKRFKELTTGNPILMGRKTYESIGKPLPNRTNIILSKNENLKIDGCLVYSDWRHVLPIFENQHLYVIGGEEIYRQLLPVTDRLELTIIDKEFEGDAYFPLINQDRWKGVSIEEKTCDEFNYRYVTYERKY
jgi:dihydrofolate reductase